MDYLRKEYRKQKETFLPLNWMPMQKWIGQKHIFTLRVRKLRHIFCNEIRGSDSFHVKSYPFEKEEAFF